MKTKISILKYREFPSDPLQIRIEPLYRILGLGTTFCWAVTMTIHVTSKAHGSHQ